MERRTDFAPMLVTQPNTRWSSASSASSAGQGVTLPDSRANFPTSKAFLGVLDGLSEVRGTLVRFQRYTLFASNITCWKSTMVDMMVMMMIMMIMMMMMIMMIMMMMIMMMMIMMIMMMMMIMMIMMMMMIMMIMMMMMIMMIMMMMMVVMMRTRLD